MILWNFFGWDAGEEGSFALHAAGFMLHANLSVFIAFESVLIGVMAGEEACRLSAAGISERKPTEENGE
ncbi:MAG: hypothetical protein ACOY3D_06300 [Candidatus Omnitrophota bacterium]